MCGICGIVDFGSSSPSREDLIPMSEALVHRGPDDRGDYVGRHAALAHRRLAIIDLEKGHQPLQDPSGQVTLVFNGEIYNYIELRKQLEKDGHIFHTRSDTEVLLNAYLRYGTDALEHLIGDFAFAVWDARHDRLFAARDRLGLKPLFYCLAGKKFIFASEIKSIFKYPGCNPPQINLNALSDYLFSFYVLGDETMFKGIKGLPAGHYLIFTAAGLEINRYWDIPFDQSRTHDAVSRVREMVEEAVKIQLRSDVALGLTLSGGLDSSCVCAAATAVNRSPINTYTVSYRDNVAYFAENPDKTFEGVTGDDTHYSQVVADQYQTRHTPLIYDLTDYALALDRVIWHREKPLLVMSEFGHLKLAEAAKAYVTVLLTGQGGDEVFGGYYYWLDRRTPDNTDYFPWVMRLGEDGRPPVTAYDWMKYLLSDALKQSGDFCSRSEEIFRQYMAAGQTDDFKNKLSYLMVKIHLQELLEVEDRLGMASSVEIRCPLCDYRLVEYVFSLPFDRKFRRNEEKALLRDAFRADLPRPVLQRKKSQFPIPMQSSQFYRHVATTLLQDDLHIHEYFRRDGLKELCRELEHRPIAALKYVAFRLYTLERWHAIFLAT
ncbi:MAG: asparagine synthase (glutamine-hydrolyzing) [Desulfobacterales bacterium]|nr:MAG: asparagine synthase (glutamine-hydrolyzing) [Desulfobacterales bacterium]